MMIYRVGLTLLGAKHLTEVLLAVADCLIGSADKHCASRSQGSHGAASLCRCKELLLHVSSSCPRLFEWSRRRDEAHCVYAQADRLRCLRQVTAMNESPAVDREPSSLTSTTSQKLA